MDAPAANAGLFAANDATAIQAILEVIYVPLEDSTLVYTRPAFNVPDGQTFRWSVLLRASARIDVTPPTAFDKDQASDGYLIPEFRTIRHPRPPGPDETVQMFTGVTTGPVDGIPAVDHFQLGGGGAFFIPADKEHP